MQKLTLTIQDEAPVGIVQMYAGATTPNGWLPCDGSAVSRTAYVDLFAAIGITYGAGDGSITFNLPDFRGLFPRGAGSQTLNGITYATSLGSKQNDAFQGHRHTEMIPLVEPIGSGGTSQPGAGEAYRDNSTYIGDPKSDASNGPPRTAAETRPANLAMNFIIKSVVVLG